MPSLPETIQTDILSRLPVKTLIRFKSVCKPWYSLFHSPYFIKMHLDRGIGKDDNTSLMLHYCYGSNDSAALYSIEYNSLSSKLSSLTCNAPLGEAVKMDYPLVLPNYFLISGSYDGLLWLQTGMLPGSPEAAIFLWNASTMEYKKIPDSPNKLACGDRDASLCWLGYDNKIDDFKLVKIVMFVWNW